MTKIPSVVEVVEAIRQRHIHLKANNPVGFVHLFADIKKALTADRLALLTELRDCELLEEKEEHQDWCKLTGELEYSSCGCWKDHNTLARAVKEFMSNMDKV
jgi:hypothetical protein